MSAMGKGRPPGIKITDFGFEKPLIAEENARQQVDCTKQCVAATKGSCTASCICGTNPRTTVWSNSAVIQEPIERPNQSMLDLPPNTDDMYFA